MNGSMAYLLATVGCLAGVTGAVIALVALTRSRRRKPGTNAEGADPFRDGDSDALRGDPRRLRPGDLVEIRRVSYAVRGSVQLTEGDWRWAEHLLDDADGRKLWLSVEEDPDLELVLWTTEPGATVTPGAATVDFDGRRYTSDETGRATFTTVGSTGLNPTGAVRYHDYRSGDARLAFESYGDTAWEVSRGERLHRSEVMIWPQAGPGAVN